MPYRKVTKKTKVEGLANALNLKAESLFAELDGYGWRNNVIGIYDPITKKRRSAPTNAKGGSDVVGCINGQFIGIETKTTDRQSDDQKRWQHLIERAGGWYFIVKSNKELLECKKEIIRRLQSKEFGQPGMKE